MASSLRTNHPAMAPPRNQQGQSQQHQQRRPAHPTHRGPAAAGGRRPGGMGDPSLLNMADAQWLDFAEPGFDPAEYAEGFFLTHSEAEADERCAELMVRGLG